MDKVNKLKKVMFDKDISNRRLAELTRLTETYISKLRTDKATPSVATLINIANVLGVEITELVDTKGGY